MTTFPTAPRAGVPSALPVPAVPRTDHVAHDLPRRGRTRPMPRQYMPLVETTHEISNAILRFEAVLASLRAELANAQAAERRMQLTATVEPNDVDTASALRAEIEADIARFSAIRADLDQRHTAAAERERVTREAYLPQLAALRDRADALRAKIAAAWPEHAGPLAALLAESSALAHDIEVLKGRHRTALVEGILPFPAVGAPDVHQNAFIPAPDAAATPLFDGRQLIAWQGLPAGYRLMKI